MFVRHCARVLAATLVFLGAAALCARAEHYAVFSFNGVPIGFVDVPGPSDGATTTNNAWVAGQEMTCCSLLSGSGTVLDLNGYYKPAPLGGSVDTPCGSSVNSCLQFLYRSSGFLGSTLENAQIEPRCRDGWTLVYSGALTPMCASQ